VLNEEVVLQLCEITIRDLCLHPTLRAVDTFILSYASFLHFSCQALPAVGVRAGQYSRVLIELVASWALQLG